MAREKKDSKADKPGKEGKKKSGKAGIILILFLILLIGAAVAAFVLNLFEVRSMVMNALIGGSPEYAAALKEIDKKEADIADREKIVTASLAAIEQRETTLAKKNLELEDSQKALEAKFLELQDMENNLGKNSTDAASKALEASYAQAATVYAAMPAENAAEILTALNDNKKAAHILKYMEPKAAAKILSKAKSDVASDITRLMLII